MPQRLRAAWGEQAVDPALTAWLDEGEAPIYFCMTGMPVLDPAACCALIAAVCTRLGARALVTMRGEGVPPGAGHDRRLYLVNSFDYDRVLPRCRAVVHHGGSGNTQDVLRAGLPAVVIGVHSDQFFYGWRISALGIGDDFPYPKLTEDRLFTALTRALAPESLRRASELGDRAATENGVHAAADAIERLVVASSV
ncbi:glycosyltransferase [Nocardia sp. alder85J]|uniref:glycosyltransferase n=1 Tax=Nocardia sp. alder85J TaxID=2862949 RepID=UPI001CD7E7BB|nr:nucleotide disphospho-sugar-binding domain-containing protein [Nocardia sp. alder85J]MCX4090901.1 hypothetical protein [Nocardia sp. alder85J]